jgi:glycosyltransferase involved in cell wall biosynthesis
LAGGEERHVDLLEQGLVDAGVEVRRFERESSGLSDSRGRRALTGLTLTYRPGGGGIGRVVNEWAPDVVHFHNIWPLLTPAALHLSRRSGAAVVLTTHNYRFACPSGTLFYNGETHERCIDGSSLLCSLNNPRGGIAESLAYGVALELQRRLKMFQRWVDAFVAPSVFVAQMLVRAGLPEERVHSIPYGLPISGPPSPLGQTGLYMGRLSPEKGVETILKASALAPDVRLIVAGAGPLESKVRASRVEYAGMLDRQGLAAALEDAAFTLVPSEWYDNQPFAALEALAAGRPVIASQMGGLPEIVRSGINGLLIPPRAPEELAAAIRRLSTDRPFVTELGTNAFEDARTRFDLKQHIRRIVDLYGRARASRDGRQ